MIVECAQCRTKFRLDEARIGPRGAKVRCSKCSTAFVVKRPAPATDQEVAGLGGPGSVDQSAAGRQASPAQAELPDLSMVADPETLDSGDVHQVKTAVYRVPEALRSGPTPDPTAALDLDVPSDSAAAGTPISQSSSQSQADLEATMSVPMDAVGLAVKPPAGQPADLPPLPRAPDGSGNATVAGEADDLPLADADLIDDASGALSSGPAAGGGSPVSDWPDAGSELGGADLFGSPGGLAQARTTGQLDDPFAGDEFQPIGGINADGTLESPNDIAAPPIESSGPKALARIAPKRIQSKPEQAAIRAEAPPASEARGGFSLGVKLLMYVAVVGVVGAAVVLYLGGGRLDLSVIGVGKPGAAGPSLAGYRDVYPATLRSVLYPTAAGRDVLVFVGTAENRSGMSRHQIDVVAELRAPDGSVVATSRAPLGLSLGPAEISELSDPASIDEAFRALARRQGEPSVAAGASAPFTVVMVGPPADLSDLQHTVRLAGGEVVLPPPPEPARAAELEPEARKTKRKHKAKRRKGKRKAEAE